MELSYFPGCSLHATAREYDESVKAVCDRVGLSLRELDDWNCCGSTSAHSLDAGLARSLPERNLEIAERAGLDLMIPCAACYGRSKHAEAHLKGLRESGTPTFYTGKVRVSHLLDVLASPDVFPKLSEQVVRPLKDLKLVCYYGCLTVRPPKVTGASRYEDPDSMDRLVEMTGATPLPWSFKTDCCGASLTLTRSDVVVTMVGRLLGMAEEAGAEGIVVACSMCHANLDVRQREASGARGKSYDLPIFYISELLCLAMGLPGTNRWWKRHLTDPTGLLSRRGLA
jgi:heterodisulfide reductase subunit B